MAAYRMSGRLRDLAAYLAERRGQFVSRRELLERVFGHQAESRSRTIDTHISRLCALLGDREEILLVRSRQRHGYVLAARPGAEL
jgi:DNA-binding response OmpR family regulator